MADKFCIGFQKKGVMGSNSESQPAGEEADQQVWIPFPFKEALTVHFYLISPRRKKSSQWAQDVRETHYDHDLP